MADYPVFFKFYNENNFTQKKFFIYAKFTDQNLNSNPEKIALLNKNRYSDSIQFGGVNDSEVDLDKPIKIVVDVYDLSTTIYTKSFNSIEVNSITVRNYIDYFKKGITPRIRVNVYDYRVTDPPAGFPQYKGRIIVDGGHPIEPDLADDEQVDQNNG
jgi:hypothetical protein